MEDQKSLNPAQKGAQKYFTKAAQDDTLAKELRKKERSAMAAKTAKLRALRLAKEAADKEEADRLAGQKTDAAPSPKPKRVTAPAAKAAKVTRITY